MRLGSHPLDQVTMQGVRTAALPGGSLLAWLHHHCLLPMQTLAAGVPGLTPSDLSLCQLISLTWWSKLSTWWVEPTPQDHCPWFFSHLFLFAAVFFYGLLSFEAFVHGLSSFSFGTQQCRLCQWSVIWRLPWRCCCILCDLCIYPFI